MSNNNYQKILKRIINQYSYVEMVTICKALNKIYNIYDSEETRWTQLQYLLSKTSTFDINLLKDEQLSNWVINDLIFKFYPCERVIKYHLINKLRKMADHIVAFEMSIGSSRIDICRINGASYAYEIKTEFDTFERLERQMYDYSKAFEKVYLVVPICLKKQAIKVIPNNCGLITYRFKNSNIYFSYAKKATKNKCDFSICVNSLSSTDLTELLKLLKIKKIPTLKEDKLKLVLDIVHEKSIWAEYKLLLKNKYKTKWDFVVQRFSKIIPIDVQNFFSTNIDPDLTYYNMKEVH